MLVTNGSNAKNASEIRPRESLRKLINLHNQTTTMPNNNKTTNYDTTRNVFARSAGRLDILPKTAEIESQVLSLTGKYKTKKCQQQKTESSDNISDSRTMSQVTQETTQHTQTEDYNNCYDGENKDEFDSNSKNL